MGKKVSEIKHDHNNSFDQLLIDADRGALEEKLSPFMTRPAYAHTSMEQKKMFPENRCRLCGYYLENEFGKEECQFPWNDPQDHDLAAHPYLPCVKEADHEED